MDDRVDVQRMAAFTRDPAGGNPAGVLVAADLPAPEDMQRIAAEVGYSETAFLAPVGEDSYTVRYFSPEAEVDFCGHATIAAGVVLGQSRGPGRFELRTNAGRVDLDVRVEDGQEVATLTSVAPRHREIPAARLREALELLGWTAEDLDDAIPPVEAYAGAWHLVLAVGSRATLAGMSYPFEALRAFMLDRGLTTVQAVWREDDTTFVARNPFPVGGVVEDPATGAAAAALGGYLRDAGLLRAPADLTIHQGIELGRPSVISVHVPSSGGIQVRGTAVDLGR